MHVNQQCKLNSCREIKFGLNSLKQKTLNWSLSPYLWHKSSETASGTYKAQVKVRLSEGSLLWSRQNVQSLEWSWTNAEQSLHGADDKLRRLYWKCPLTLIIVCNNSFLQAVLLLILTFFLILYCFNQNMTANKLKLLSLIVMWFLSRFLPRVKSLEASWIDFNFCFHVFSDTCEPFKR